MTWVTCGVVGEWVVVRGEGGNLSVSEMRSGWTAADCTGGGTTMKMTPSWGTGMVMGDGREPGTVVGTT
jgi:hypothetical protein